MDTIHSTLAEHAQLTTLHLEASTDQIEEIPVVPQRTLRGQSSEATMVDLSERPRRIRGQPSTDTMVDLSERGKIRVKPSTDTMADSLDHSRTLRVQPSTDTINGVLSSYRRLRVQPSTETAFSAAGPGVFPFSESTIYIEPLEELPAEGGDDHSINSQFEREAYGTPPGRKSLDQFEVRFGLDDPTNPHNRSRIQRWYITIVAGILVMNACVFGHYSLDARLTLLSGRSRVRPLQASCPR